MRKTSPPLTRPRPYFTASHMKIRTILTGATGMVGEGVLLECLQNPAVEQVLVLTRKPTGRTHAKLNDVFLRDLS